MKKKRLACLCLATCTLLVSCKEEPEAIEPQENGYESFYHLDTSKREEKTGKARYYASDGYFGNEAQGYNHYFYKALSNGPYQDLSFEEGKFLSKDGTYLENERMHSSAFSQAVRSFVSPLSGRTKIKGTLRLGEEAKTAALSIKILNSKKEIVRELGEWACNDQEGTYIEARVELKEGDEIVFILSSDTTVSFNPCIDFALEAESLLHQNIDGQYGDVHPYYDEENDRMIMYYLSTGEEKNSTHERFSTLASVSTDMVNFSPLELKRKKDNPPGIDTYYVLNVYKDAEGIYRSCCGAGAYFINSKSKDLIAWENGEEPYLDEDGSMQYFHRVVPEEGVYATRDPHIFYDEERETYYCICGDYYTSKITEGKKGIAIYQGDKTGRFSRVSKHAIDLTGKGNPECNQIFKIQDRYYIFYSLSGTGTAGGVGKLAYRVGDAGKNPFEVDWESKEERYLDGGDNHAAQLVEAKGKYYFYGWLTPNPHMNGWGGPLSLSKEVFVKEDGSLGVRLDPEYQKYVNKGRFAEFTVENPTFKNVPRCILSGDFAIPNSGSVKEGFRVTSGDSTYFAGVMNKGGSSYLTITKNDDPTSFIYMPIETKRTLHIEVYLDGAYIEAFLDNEYSVSSHVPLLDFYDVKCVSSLLDQIKNACVKKLASAEDFLL
ncbi:MAG: hypothetical protein ACI32C_03710 [Candidatus Enteromonas sp.]